MEQEEKVATTEMNSSYVANLIESNDAIIQNMDIWLRGNAGEELGLEEQRVHALLVHITNEMAYFAVAAVRRLEDDKAADLDAAVFAGFLHENPGARRVWRDREQRLGKYRGLVQPGELTTSSWVELIESHLAVFDGQALSIAQ